jgi:uncharacterized membrane protein
MALVSASILVMSAGTSNAHEAHRADKKAAAVQSLEQPVDSAHEATEPPSERPAPPGPSAAVADPHLHSAHSAHSDHEAGHASDRWLPSPLIWLGRLHPMVIHFPIALFISALIAEFWLLIVGSEPLRQTVRFAVWGGLLGATAAVPLGWLFASSGATESGWMLEAHRWSGSMTLGFGVLLAWLVERAESSEASRTHLRIALVLQAVLVSATGFLGGSLLYGIDHLWRAIE